MRVVISHTISRARGNFQYQKRDTLASYLFRFALKDIADMWASLRHAKSRISCPVSELTFGLQKKFLAT